MPRTFVRFWLVAALVGCSGTGTSSAPDAAGDSLVTVDARGDADSITDANAVSESDATTDAASTRDAQTASDTTMDSESVADSVPNTDTQATSDTTTIADADGAPDAANACAGGPSYAASNAGSDAQVTDYGFVRWVAQSSNQIVAFNMTLAVPAEPPASGTLFLWPGLQPNTGGANFDTLNNGVLQPVLTWGPTCAPNSPTNAYGSWWISGQYVNTYITSASPNYTAYNGCHGGPGMDVAVGDNLNIAMTLSGTNWIQTVTDARTNESVSYTIDMLGQGQNIAEYDIEGYSQAPVADVIFTNITMTFAASEPSACQPVLRGTNDYFSAPQASTDGKTCCLSKVILRAQGVAATSPDSP